MKFCFLRPWRYDRPAAIERRTEIAKTRHRWAGLVQCKCTNRKCKNYQKRFTLKKRPEQYVQAWRGSCPSCGFILWVDKHRTSGREQRMYNCNCGGRPWRHRRKSPFCIHSKEAAAGFVYDEQDTPEFRAWLDAGKPAKRDELYIGGEVIKTTGDEVPF